MDVYFSLSVISVIMIHVSIRTQHSALVPALPARCVVTRETFSAPGVFGRGAGVVSPP